MRNQNLKTINLTDGSFFNIYGFANAFQPVKIDKLPSPCAFFKANNLKHYRYKKSKDGNVILTAVSKDGKSYHFKERNFQMAFIKLVRNFKKS